MDREPPHCVFLNGLPGSGKSTFATRLIAGRPHWLSLDIDVLRGLLGIAAVDFRQAGDEVRPLARALLDAQLGLGRNVVVPQLFFDPSESAQLEAVAEASGARVSRFLISVSAAECWDRVRRRGLAAPPGSLEHRIHELIRTAGGLAELHRMAQQLEVWSRRPDPPVAVSSYAALHEVLLTRGAPVAEMG